MTRHALENGNDIWSFTPVDAVTVLVVHVTTGDFEVVTTEAARATYRRLRSEGWNLPTPPAPVVMSVEDQELADGLL